MTGSRFTTDGLALLRSLVSTAQYSTARKLADAATPDERQFYVAALKKLADLERSLKPRNADKALERAMAADEAAIEEQEEPDDEGEPHR